MAAVLLPITILVSLLLAPGATANNGYTTPSPPPASQTPAPAPASTSYTPPPPVGKGGDKQRIRLRVEGLVMCQSCAKRGWQSLDGAAQLEGAKVTVTCRDRKNRVIAWRKAAADENGYFVARFGVERLGDYYMGDPAKACFVRLLASPDAKCNGITNVNGGMVGAQLRDEGKRWTVGYENVVYAAGPLAFKPSKCVPTRPY
jgi:hypothetical protein